MYRTILLLTRRSAAIIIGEVRYEAEDEVVDSV
jgi:hypothetical protein